MLSAGGARGSPPLRVLGPSVPGITWMSGTWFSRPIALPWQQWIVCSGIGLREGRKTMRFGWMLFSCVSFIQGSRSSGTKVSVPLFETQKIKNLSIGINSSIIHLEILQSKHALSEFVCLYLYVVRSCRCYSVACIVQYFISYKQPNIVL